MIVHNVGFDHRHDADFFIDRPNGSGDNLLLILRTDAVFTLNGKDVYVPAKSLFLYPEGMPQQYRSAPQRPFANDWMHFLFEDGEEQWFLSKGIPFAEPVPLQYTQFYSHCIKAIADENSTKRLHSAESIRFYFGLICNKASEALRENGTVRHGTQYEMLLTVRNEVYANPFRQWNAEWGAHQTRMSVSSFHAHYKQQFRVTFIQDVIRARTEYAQMLLRTTDIPVSDIAVQCGYRSYEHFARQFKRTCGMPPLEYRRNNLEKM